MTIMIKPVLLLNLNVLYKHYMKQYYAIQNTYLKYNSQSTFVFLSGKNRPEVRSE